jgi:hypothetical protein
VAALSLARLRQEELTRRIQEKRAKAAKRRKNLKMVKPDAAA